MEKQRKYVSAKRADKLINELIGYLSELKKMAELIQTLINCGFTYEELVTFYSFDPDEIAESFESKYSYSVDDDNELYVYENGYLLATVSDVDPSGAQNMFEEVIFDKIAETLGITNTGHGVIVGRPIEGIGINGDEYLLNNEGVELVFNTEEQAREFLIEKGGYAKENVDDCVMYHHSIGTCKRCRFPLFKSPIPGYTSMCINCYEDFYGFEQDCDVI